MTLRVVEPTLTARAALVLSAFLVLIYFALSAATETALSSSDYALKAKVGDLVSAVQSKGIVIKDSLTRGANTAPSTGQLPSRSARGNGEGQAENLLTIDSSASMGVEIPAGIAVLPEIDPAQLLDLSVLERTQASLQKGATQPKGSIKAGGKAKGSRASEKKIVAREGDGAHHGNSKSAGEKGTGASQGGNTAS